MIINENANEKNCNCLYWINIGLVLIKSNGDVNLIHLR